MTTERSTKKQRELLLFVDAFIKEHGYGPSYREIMNGLGYRSVSTVAVHIDGLIAKGYVRKRDNSARSLEVVSSRYGSGDTTASGAMTPGPGESGDASDDRSGVLAHFEDEKTSGIRPGTMAQGRWLRGAVEDRFVRYNQTHDAKLLDEVYVLIGALKILGFDEAYRDMRAELGRTKQA